MRRGLSADEWLVPSIGAPHPAPLSRAALFASVALALAPGVFFAAENPSATVPPAREISTVRPWTRWWWPGSAVDRGNLTRQLEEFATAGLGGVEITPIYGARGTEDRYRSFLSPPWVEMLAYTCREARRLGLGVDMATGTGWPFGGPWVSSADASSRIVLVEGRLAGAPTNMKVKRAAPGGEGLVLDPYSPAALEHYLATFTTALADLPRGSVRAQFHDSFEYYESGWTPALPETFRRMHGYDLQEHAAELMGAAPADPDTLRRLKSDYRATLAQLHLDYLRAWARWAHEHGFIVRNQSHGAPANLLDLYGAVDIPETETFGSTPFPIPGLRRNPGDVRPDQDLPESLVIRLASSAAHVMGRPLASSETCTWLREHWKEALAFTKPEIDRLFTDGINHVLYHGTVYSPRDATWPGWLFYASTQFNPNNPWWDDFAALNAYVTRIQTVLQAGRPDNDVLLYWPFADVLDDPDGLMKQYGVHNVQWLRESAAGRLATTLINEGFSFDFISDEQLQSARVENGLIVTAGGRYRAVVIPATRRMPVETLSQLLRLQQRGTAVIYEGAPEDVPGLGRLAERRAQFHEVKNAIGLSGAMTGNITAELRRRGAVREPVTATGLRFIRRAGDSGHDYFFANLTDRAVDQWVPLGAPVHSAVIEDPLTGRSGLAAVKPGVAGTAQVYLQLAAGETLLLHTQSGDAALPKIAAWRYPRPAAAPIPLTGEWSVTFIKGGPDLPAPLATAELKSWTELGGEEAQRFAGTARYRLEFDRPATPADDWLLDLGDMRESARVRLNGTEVTTAWSLPFRVRVGAQLKPGRNVLELDVTNLAANRIRDLDRRHVEWKIMREINFVNINYKPFDASGWDLSPSGLLGPVALAPLRVFDPAAAP